MLNKLIGPAAIAAMTAQYRAELAHRSEHTIVGQLHRALTAGCADQILDGLRDSFTAHAEQIAHARSLGINAESSPEHILASAEPGTIEAWNTLDDHIGAVSAIGAIAIRFGPRMVIFRSSASTPGPRISGWSTLRSCAATAQLSRKPRFFKHLIVATALRHGPAPNSKLQTIESATQRYNGFAAAEFDRVNDRDPGGWVDQKTGEVHPFPGPRIRIARRLRREQATQ